MKKRGLQIQTDRWTDTHDNYCLPVGLCPLRNEYTVWLLTSLATHNLGIATATFTDDMKCGKLFYIANAEVSNPKL